MEERRAGTGAGDALIKTISSRIAGGRREVNKEPSRVQSYSSYQIPSLNRLILTTYRSSSICVNSDQHCHLFFMHQISLSFQLLWLSVITFWRPISAWSAKVWQTWYLVSTVVDCTWIGSRLYQSLNTNYRYTQCELMSVHYKNPVLLIEFEEDKAFSLDASS